MNEAIRQVTHVQNIRYDKATERLYIIDQTLLPNEEKEIELRTVEEMIEAIKMLRIRGAPAIGICAGYCMYALARDIDAKDNEAFYRKLQIDGELPLGCGAEADAPRHGRRQRQLGREGSPIQSGNHFAAAGHRAQRVEQRKVLLRLGRNVAERRTAAAHLHIHARTP